jgi:hypothetical protein
MQEIRFQEVFRREVQQDLSQNTPTPNFAKRLILFFNTPLGLWILSSIALACLVNFYATLVNHFERVRTNKATAAWIDLEIEHHFENLKLYLDEGGPFIQRGYAPKYYLNGMIGNLGGEPLYYSAVFPIAINRSLHSIMFELSTYTDDHIEKSRIEAAARSASSLFDHIILLR